MATLLVGPNRPYATIAAALAAARDGDTVSVSAGTYANDFGTIRTKVSLVASGGQVTLLATRPLASGGALLTVGADATIDGFIFANAATSDGTAAGLLYTAGALTLRNSLFTGNQTGLLALADPAGTILVQSSEFARNGANDGFTHNLAVAAVKSLTIQDSYIHDAAGGAEIRSRAKQTTITASRIADNAGTGTVAIDLPNAGAVTVQDTIIEKGAAAGPVVIRYGGDAAYAASSLRVSGSTVVADRTGALLLQNQTAVTATLAGNTVFGLAQPLATGPAAVSATTIPALRPAISAAPLITPTFTLPVEYGRPGAVTASGVIRTVGPTGTYATLGAAVAAAQGGDTIRVAAGTYTDDAVTIDKKLIIEGTGGLARFVATRPPANGLAQFVTSADVTLRNIEVTGTAIPGGTAAAILTKGGALTIVNSFIHDNQAGLVATGGRTAVIAAYDTEFARNGTPDGRGGNIDVGVAGTLTLRNDWIHDGLAGPELRSRADNTVLDGDRISQVHGAGAAAIDLPNGGRATIASSAIEKGAASQQTPLVHVGGGTPTPGSTLTVTGTTLIDPLPAPAGLIVAEPGAATISAANTPQTGLTVTTTAPWASTGAPAPGALTTRSATPIAERGVLTLRISGQSWRGDARFTLTVDGEQVGGTLTASASHTAGQTQPFIIAGQFAPGPHSVAVRFVNDLNGAGNDGRALYLDGATFDGEAFGRPASLPDNGAVTLATAPVTRPTAIAINLSEDAAAGDASAFIAIDGTVLGGLQTVAASHAAGASQPMRFLLDLAPGPHTVSVTALNATGDRHLYVDSLDIAGQHYPGATAPVAPASTFAFTVAPPAAANTDLFLTAGLPEVLLAF